MKKAYSSVFILLILGSIVFLMLVFAEAASGYAADSICENLFNISGRSVLSEYRSELFESYGIFAIRNSDAVLEKYGNYYLKNSLENRSCVVKVKLNDFRIDCNEYGMLNLANKGFSSQIEKLGAMSVGEYLIEHTDIAEIVSKLSSSTENRLKDVVKQLEELKTEGNEASEDNDPSLLEKHKQAKKLLNSYESSNNYDCSSKSGNSISAANLPSDILSLKERQLLLFSGGLKEISKESLFQAFYIRKNCSNLLHRNENGVILNECEYILFGNKDDSTNEKRTKESIFKLRLSLNLLYIMSDKEMLSKASSAASTLFSLIPYPVAFLAVCSVWAGIEAKTDMNILLDGKNVPLWKSKESWKTDIYSALDGEIANDDEKGKLSFGSYEDYICLLLTLLNENERLARLMDIMEMNINANYNCGFVFSEYGCGFSMSAEFEKKPLLSEYSPRKKTIEREFVYQ